LSRRRETANNGWYGFFDFPYLLKPPPFVTVPSTGSKFASRVPSSICECAAFLPLPIESSSSNVLNQLSI
jgi:hypothetical protein